MKLETTAPVALAGDWHGSISQGAKVLDWAAEQGVHVILHLGDFGIWHNDKPFLNKLEQRLEIHDQILLFVDGNHEDFPRLYAKPVTGNGMRKVRDRIFHLPRGFRFTINDTSFLALGGAASIDRKFRVLDRSYWEEELITEEDVQKSLEGGHADVMLCHDSPSSAPNTVVDDVMGQMRAQLSFGAENVARCNVHREQLERVVSVVQPKYLFHGHYHALMTGIMRHPDGNVTIVHGLDEGVAKIPQHTALFETRTHL